MPSLVLNSTFSGKADDNDAAWTLPGDGNAYIGCYFGGLEFDIRTVYKYALDPRLINARIESLVLNVYCSITLGNGHLIDIGGAGGTGLYDPTGVFSYPAADLVANPSWQYITDSAILDNFGTYNLALGAKAITDLVAAVVAGNYWTLAFVDTAPAYFSLGAIADNFNVNASTLTVEYTPNQLWPLGLM